MANTDDWLYNDDLDVGLLERDRLGSTDSRVLDGEDLLDDVLTAPAAAPPRTMGHTPTNEDELLGMKVKMDETALEESGSARFNAEQMARTVQARIEANRTSQGGSSHGPNIYAREPNRLLSFYVGNLTWWTTDQDLILAVKEAGLKEVTNIKFFENRANGQSKGYALIELTSDALAMSAPEKFQELTIHNQKPLVIYAPKISAHQFESKCNQIKSGISPSSFTPNNGSSASKPPRMPPAVPQAPPIAPPTRPPMPLPGFPLPPMPGFRPPGLPNPTAGLPGLPPPIPPFPPFPHLGNPLAAKGLPGMLPPFPTPHLGDPSKMGVAPHLNPAFLQEMSHGGNMAELFAQAAARFKNQAAALSAMGSGKQPSEEEASEANNRNRAISSSAISRAMADANAGDYDSAMDVLRMAITLIKQSVTAGTEASQILIQSLQDCVRGIDEQAANTKRPRGREHRSHDDRDRVRSSGHRSHPTKHHRDRSRERRR